MRIEITNVNRATVACLCGCFLASLVVYSSSAQEDTPLPPVEMLSCPERVENLEGLVTAERREINELRGMFQQLSADYRDLVVRQNELARRGTPAWVRLSQLWANRTSIAHQARSVEYQIASVNSQLHYQPYNYALQQTMVRLQNDMMFLQRNAAAIDAEAAPLQAMLRQIDSQYFELARRRQALEMAADSLRARGASHQQTIAGADRELMMIRSPQGQLGCAEEHAARVQEVTETVNSITHDVQATLASLADLEERASHVNDEFSSALEQFRSLGEQ